MDATRTSDQFPVRVEARLDEPLSRWLWLVKWLLLIPHYLVLVLLWIAFVVTTVVAFVAILATGRYPHGIFHFNVGVLRWTWRVAYYGYGALGTDRYPPFTLGPVPDYPATLDVAYPQRLSRGLVLVKWWLLALPHYLILAVLAGGIALTTSEVDDPDVVFRLPQGLLSLAVLFVAIALLFVGRYPRGLFDLVTGVNRWAYRVIPYAALMTDAYPPFRLDQGGADPAADPGPAPDDDAGTTRVAAGSPGSPTGAGVTGTAQPGSAQRGAAGPVVALVLGLLLILPAIGLTAASGALFWIDSERDADGFVGTDVGELDSQTAAVTVEDVDLTLEPEVAQWLADNDLGRVRVRVAGEDAVPLFVGIARESDVNQWLAGVAHDEVAEISDDSGVTYTRADGPVSALRAPGELDIWAASTSGSGTRQLDWRVQDGRWALVVARAAGGTGVHASGTAAITIPDLTGLAVGLLVGGLALLVGGGALIALGATGLGRRAGAVGPPVRPGPLP